MAKYIYFVGCSAMQAVSVCSAGGLLEGVCRGSASLPSADPAVLLLDSLVLDSCQNASQAAAHAASNSVPGISTMQSAACAESESGPGSSAMQTEGALLWRNAAGYACCQVFQVSGRLRCRS
jgi:hypothetical protein